MAGLLIRARRGALAGAVGTLALELVAYGDMLARGRPASEMPGRAAAQLAGRLGVDLSGDDEGSKNRREALGAALGYATGLGVGIALGLVTPPGRRVHLVRHGLAFGAAATAASAVPMTVQGLTDPREWGWTGWLEDAIPHAAYGLATAAALRALR